MPCELGQRLHQEFEVAIAARIAVEERIGLRFGSKIEHARRVEHTALMARSFHVSRCEKCWLDPPRSHQLPANTLTRPSSLRTNGAVSNRDQTDTNPG